MACACRLTDFYNCLNFFIILPSTSQGEEAAPSLEPERGDSSTRSYSMEELLNDLTKSDQARLLFHSWISVFHFGYLKFIVTISHISPVHWVAVRLMFPVKEKMCELTDLHFPSAYIMSNLVFGGIKNFPR